MKEKYQKRWNFQNLVNCITKKYTKFNTITRIKGSGGEKLLGEEDLKILKNIVENSPIISAKKISIEIYESIEKQISISTIHNELKYIDFISAIPRKLPLLTSKNIIDRFNKASMWSS